LQKISRKLGETSMDQETGTKETRRQGRHGDGDKGDEGDKGGMEQETRGTKETMEEGGDKKAPGWGLQFGVIL
jgi:hypothetical protein